MPALYSTVADFQNSAIGQALAPYWPTQPGVLDQYVAGGSDAVETFCDRILLYPPTVTLTAQASVGATQLSVNNATNIHANDVAVFSTGEIVEIQGADVSNWAASSPYTGTVYLNAPLANQYANSSSVTIYRQCRYTSKGRSTSPLDQQGVDLSQQAQIAQGHAPKLGTSAFARKIFVNQRPLLSVYAATYTLPWAGNTAELKADLTNITYFNEQGWFRLPVGFPNFLDTQWRIQFAAGFRTIPYDIKQAVHWWVANEVAKTMNPLGAVELRSDGQLARISHPTGSSGKAAMNTFLNEFERCLADYKRKGF